MKMIYNGTADSRLYKNVLGETIAELLENDPKVCYLDADLMSCIGTAKLPKKYDRAINCGIAEANMIGIAGGLSASGFKPICHSFGPFASRRCYDQVFLSGGYAKNSITIIGTDPGITAAFNGGTHMPFEDVAIYRAIPGATIVDVTDVTIVATGIMVHEAMQAALKLEAEGISAAVIDPFTVKPLDAELIRTYAAKTGCVVTAENHNKIGGLYSAVKEVLDGEAKTGYVAIEDEFGEVGPQDYLRKRFDLTDDHIVRVVKETLAKK